jgi:hypothetical protein
MESSVLTVCFPGGGAVEQLPMDAAGMHPTGERMPKHTSNLADSQTAIPCLLIPCRAGFFRRAETDSIGILHSAGGRTVRLMIDVTSTVADHVCRKRHCWLPPFPRRLRVRLAP